MEATCASETSVHFNGLPGLVSQKIEIFTTELHLVLFSEDLTLHLICLNHVFAVICYGP
jgi:hypothetical protein